MPEYRQSRDDRTPGAGSDPRATKSRGRRRRAVQLFDKEGLRAVAAAEAVMDLGPLRWGADGQFWAYSGGVWRPGEDEVHARIVRVLGDRYRPAHSHTVRDVIRAMVPRIDCDPVPELINFRNGLLNWRTGELLPHDPDVPSTVQLTVEWDPSAQCELFHSFLSEVVAEDDRPRVWEIIGYMLMSGNPLHRAFLLAGGGRNGKGAFMRTILAILGKENVSHVPLDDFSKNRFATAQLFGKLANVCGDIDSTYMEFTGRFKEATGEDEVNAEHKFGQPFRFRPWCSMLFSANEIPGSADSSRGWIDRWEIVAFPNYIGDRIDPTLEPRLQSPESLRGIAAAGVAALRVLMDRGRFRETRSGRAAKDDFARRANVLYGWVDDRVTVTGETRDFEKGMVLYEDYRVWADEMAGLKIMSRTKFYEKLRQLGDLGIVPTKRNGVDGFKGLRLGRRPAADDA